MIMTISNGKLSLLHRIKIAFKVFKHTNDLRVRVGDTLTINYKIEFRGKS